ncbi:MAG: hypothetical protein PHN31_00755 [Candidatus Gracilibacteria bacterium]|nr:hypothetical protein [Candidatus Gracilibacteria bacterium]
MINFFSKYKKKKAIRTYGIITMSLILALGINFLVLDSSIGQKLQISVINSGENNKTGDVYLNINNNVTNLIANKDMLGIKSFSLSIAYNPTNVTVSEIKTIIGGNMINEENEEGFTTIILNLSTPVDVKKGDSIVSFINTKKEEKLENINLVNVNFTDSTGEVYLLSSSGLEF